LEENNMGFESFGVSLEGGRVTADEAIRVIDSLDGVSREDGFTTGSTYFLARDGRHAIELELMHTPVWLSCRFTLCHPPSVDSAFLQCVKQLMEKLDMRVEIRDDVTPEHSQPYSLDRFNEFSKACLHYIAARRREWKLAFGNRELAATTAEAHQHIISAHYLSSVEQPG
jgi:hypothetical protein